MKNYAYYPGCSALKSATELDLATRAVLAKLDVRWAALDNVACCGSRECGGLRVADEQLALMNNSRTLALAENMGADTLLNVCSTCQLEFATDNKHLIEDHELLRKVNEALSAIDLEYKGTLSIKNFLYVLVEDIGLKQIAELTVKSLKGLKFAPFYGCHLLRPSIVHDHGEDPYKPRAFGSLIEELGGEEIWFSGATKCCGFHSILVSPKTSLKMSGYHLLEAKEKGADFIVTPCPLCHTMLDSYQPSIEKELGINIGLPILHLSQMVGLAMGLRPKMLGLLRHMVDPTIKLSERSLVA